MVDSSHFVLTFEKPQSPGLSLNCFFISKFCSNTHGSQVLRQNQACSRDGLVGGVGQGWNFFVQICSLPKYPSFLEGDLTHVAFGYGGYIRLTVRPQHQVGRFFFFLRNSESVSTTSARHALATSIDNSKETKRGVYLLDITFYLCEPIQFEILHNSIEMCSE